MGEKERYKKADGKIGAEKEKIAMGEEKKIPMHVYLFFR